MGSISRDKVVSITIVLFCTGLILFSFYWGGKNNINSKIKEGDTPISTNESDYSTEDYRIVFPRLNVSFQTDYVLLLADLADKQNNVLKITTLPNHEKDPNVYLESIIGDLKKNGATEISNKNESEMTIDGEPAKFTTFSASKSISGDKQELFIKQIYVNHKTKSFIISYVVYVNNKNIIEGKFQAAIDSFKFLK